MIDRLVVAGARGFLADYMFAGLAKLGIVPVAVIDNNPKLWGESAGGIRIAPPAEIVRQHPAATYVTAVFNHTPLRRQLSGLGADKVITYAQLFRKYPEVFLPYLAVDLPSKLTQNAEAIKQAADCWADEESRRLYAGLMEWFETLNSDAVPPPLPSAETYFPEFLRLRSDEVFVDCGAFDGDTLRQYLQVSRGQFSRIFCLEPDPSNFSRLESFAKSLPAADRIELIHAAATHDGKSLQFAASGNVASHAASGKEQTEKSISIPGIRLDDLTPRPTFVKMDIEGSEMSAIRSGDALLRSGKAVWAITLYHHLEDFWRIPLHMRSAAPELRLYLRHYAEDYAETICYAIPPDRVI